MNERRMTTRNNYRKNNKFKKQINSKNKINAGIRMTKKKSRKISKIPLKVCIYLYPPLY